MLKIHQNAKKMYPSSFYLSVLLEKGTEMVNIMVKISITDKDTDLSPIQLSHAYLK